MVTDMIEKLQTKMEEAAAKHEKCETDKKKSMNK
jgi:hypothetical protein